MAFNRDATVSSSQDEVLDASHSSTSVSETRIKQRYSSKNPNLKMVAKVFPTVRKEDKPESDDDDVIIETVQEGKKQAFPWLTKFNKLCVNVLVSCHTYQRLDRLMDVYIRRICKDVVSCLKKPIRASNLKVRMNDSLKFFHMMYKVIKKPLDEDCYFDRMSDLLAMYLDLEMRASRRGMESQRVISARLTSILFVMLENSKSHILNSILKARLFVKMFREICIPIIRKVLQEIPAELDEVTYIKYILVFKKWKALVIGKEKREISLMAAQRLEPPPGLIDEYHSSDKYNGLLPVVAKGKREKFTLLLMQAPGLNAKGVIEGYAHTSELNSNPDALLEHLEPSETERNEEQYFLYFKENSESRRRCSITAREVWLELDNHCEDARNIITNELFDLQYLKGLKKQQETKEKLRLEEDALKVKKIKEEKLEEDERIVPTVVFKPNSIPRRTAECFGFATSTQTTIKKEIVSISEYNIGNTVNSESRFTTKDVPQMEADSQSQDDVIFVERVDKVIDIETDASEDNEACSQEVIQAPILRAVVRPENIEQLSLNEKEVGGRSRIEIQEIQMPGKEQEVEKIQEAEDLVPDSAEETISAEAAIVFPEETISAEAAIVFPEETISAEAAIVFPEETISAEAPIVFSEETIGAQAATVSTVDMQASSFEDSRISNGEISFEESCQRMPSSSDSIDQLLNDDVEDENVPSRPPQLLESCDPLIYWSFSDDNFDCLLNQYDDEFMGDMFSTLPQDLISDKGFVDIRPEMGSQLIADSMKDDVPEVFHQKTINSKGQSGASSSFQSKGPSRLDMDITPQVLEQDSPIKKLKGRRKTKSKKQRKNCKVKDPSPPETDIVQITEKITNVVPLKEVKGSKKGKQTSPTQRRKRGRLMSSEEAEEKQAAPEQEPIGEPLPKLKRGQTKKTPPPPPPRLASQSPPPTNKQKPKGKKQTKKKAQSKKK